MEWLEVSQVVGLKRIEEGLSPLGCILPAESLQVRLFLDECWGRQPVGRVLVCPRNCLEDKFLTQMMDDLQEVFACSFLLVWECLTFWHHKGLHTWVCSPAVIPWWDAMSEHQAFKSKTTSRQMRPTTSWSCRILHIENAWAPQRWETSIHCYSLLFVSATKVTYSRVQPVWVIPSAWGTAIRSNFRANLGTWHLIAWGCQTLAQA